MDPETNFDTGFVPQGIGADLIATVEGWDRDDVDAFALRSQQRAAKAWEENRFADSVVPVKDINEEVVLDKDEFIRPATTMEDLAQLKPSFEQMGEMGGFDAVALQKYHWVEKINHVHHAGNSSGIVDGAALVTIGNEKAAERYELKPKARIVSTALSGSDPTIMLTGPAPASRKALEKAGLTVEDMDLIEINEGAAVRCASSATSTPTWRRSMSTVARSRWAIRWANWSDDRRHQHRRSPPHRWQVRPRDALRRRAWESRRSWRHSEHG